MLQRVSIAFPIEDQSDSDSDADDIEINTLDYNNNEDGGEECTNGTNGTVDTSVNAKDRVLVNARKLEDQALMAFQSNGAIDYFKKRVFQGLDPGIPGQDRGNSSSQSDGDGVGDADIMKIHDGKIGVASVYNDVDNTNNTNTNNVNIDVSNSNSNSNGSDNIDNTDSIGIGIVGGGHGNK